MTHCILAQLQILSVVTETVVPNIYIFIVLLVKPIGFPKIDTVEYDNEKLCYSTASISRSWHKFLQNLGLR